MQFARTNRDMRSSICIPLVVSIEINRLVYGIYLSNIIYIYEVERIFQYLLIQQVLFNEYRKQQICYIYDFWIFIIIAFQG